MENLIFSFNAFVIIYYSILNSFYTVFFVLSLIHTFSFIRKLKFYYIKEIKEYKNLPPISIIIPAYNEASSIGKTVKSVLQLEYEYKEIIVVNDGSNDNTIEVLTKEFNLVELPFYIYRQRVKSSFPKRVLVSKEYKNLIVIDKDRGGKSDSLNCALNLAKYPYVCTMDADTICERDSLLRLVRRILESKYPVKALGGVVRVLNGVKLENGYVKEIDLPRKLLPNFQIIEYIRAFFFGRLGIEQIRGTTILSGAFSLFERETLIKLGGFSNNTVTEDLEIILRIHKYYQKKGEPYYVGFIPESLCWTIVPETISDLGRQRRRWHLGLLQNLWIYRDMIFNPKFGSIGIIVFPFYILEALGPAVEIIGFPIILISYMIGILSFEYLKLFLFLAIVYGVFLSVGGVFLEELNYKRYPGWRHLLKLILFGIAENFGYRQLCNFFRFIAIIQFIVGFRRWELVERKEI